MIYRVLFFLLVSVIFCSCGDDIVYTPKPRAYPKVDFPEKKYQAFNENYCDFKFEYPVYTNVQQDTSFFGEKPTSSCWFDLHTPHFDTRIYCSYYPINKENNFEKLRNDAFKLVSKHNIKANYIDELPIQKDNNVNGFVFDIDGPVASPFQFYLSDSTHHFLRGSLYFNTQAKPDSLAPIYDFVKADIMHMINTFEWVED